MANKVQQPENDIMVETKGKLELFFDNYGNKLLWALGCVTALALCAFLVYTFVHHRNEKNEMTAGAALAAVVEADGAAEEYVALVDEYAGTKAANTASYMAGAAYLESGDLANAKLYLEKYENAEGAAGELINAVVLSLRGDIAVEENDLQSAETLYREAMAMSDEPMTYTENAQKLALVYEAMGDMAKAQQCYKDIVAKYPEQKRAFAKFIAE